MTQVQLDSMKYWHDVVQLEQDRLRASKTRQARTKFVAFMLGVATMFVIYYAVLHQESWLPDVTAFFAQF